MKEFRSEESGKQGSPWLAKTGPGRIATSWPKQHQSLTANGSVRLGKEALHRGWAQLVGCIPWEVWITLTFDPERWPRRDRRLAEEETQWLLRYTERVFRRPIGWALAAERDRTGAWHSHALIAGVGDRKWNAPMATWKERCGFIHVEPVWEGQGISEYITKSVGWGGEVVLSDTLALYRRGDQRALIANSADQTS